MLKIKGNSVPFGLSGITARMLLSLFIVYGTYNPSGRSFYHWAIADGPVTPRLLIGLVILGTYVSLLYATWMWSGTGAGTRLSHWIAHELQPRLTLLEGTICA